MFEESVPGSGRNQAEQLSISAFLESAASPEHSMNVLQLDGYLRAICCGPGLSAPSEWMPQIFNGEQPEYRSEDEARNFLQAVMGLWNFHASQVMEDKCDLPVLAIYHADKTGRIDIEQWCRGFLQGFIHWENDWYRLCEKYENVNLPISYKGEGLEDQLDAVLHIVSTVADSELALKQGVHLEDMDGIFDCLAESIEQLGEIGRVLHHAEISDDEEVFDPDSIDESFAERMVSPLTQQFSQPFERDLPKVGRNDLCPCGSGKKYKKCCLH